MKKFIGIALDISKTGSRVEKIIPGSGFLFREGDFYPITQELTTREELLLK